MNDLENIKKLEDVTDMLFDERRAYIDKIKKLREENANLHEKLEESVERLKAREKSVCFGTEWKAVVTDEDIDEIFGVAEIHPMELKGETK